MTAPSILDETIIGTVYNPRFSAGHPGYSSILCITQSRRVLALKHIPDSPEMDYDEVVDEAGKREALRMFDERSGVNG
jgi:hypothetical protein